MNEKWVLKTREMESLETLTGLEEGKKNKEKVGKFGEKIKQDRRKGEGHGWQKEIKR